MKPPNERGQRLVNAGPKETTDDEAKLYTPDFIVKRSHILTMREHFLEVQELLRLIEENPILQ